MYPNDDFDKIIHEAHALRRQYIGGLLRTAWNAVFNRARIIQAQGQGMALPAMTAVLRWAARGLANRRLSGHVAPPQS